LLIRTQALQRALFHQTPAAALRLIRFLPVAWSRSVLCPSHRVRLVKGLHHCPRRFSASPGPY
jgi:hypothetical protein